MDDSLGTLQVAHEAAWALGGATRAPLPTACRSAIAGQTALFLGGVSSVSELMQKALTFYDALATNDCAVKALADGTLHANSLVALILDRLQGEDRVVDGVRANYLVHGSPTALPERSAKAVREAFFPSPKFRRSLNPERVKQTIYRCVEVGMNDSGSPQPGGIDVPRVFQATLNEGDLEITDDILMIRKQRVEADVEARRIGRPAFSGTGATDTTPPAGADSGCSPTVGTGAGAASGGGTSTVSPAPPTLNVVPGCRWKDEVTPQKWMNFYTKTPTRFAAVNGLKLTRTIEVTPDGDVPKDKIGEMSVALREPGISKDVDLLGADA